MSPNSEFGNQLPASIYRRFLIMTDFWQGTRSAPGSLIIKMHNGGEGVPFFWAGTPIDLPCFYRNLGDARSIYCFAGTFEIMTPNETTIKILANYYAAEILKVYPEGPFLLGGFCVASLLVFEIAKLLTAKGYQIDLLLLCERDLTQDNLIFKLFRFMYHYNERIYDLMRVLWASPEQRKHLLGTEFDLFINKLKKIRAKFSAGTRHKKQVADEPPYTLSAYPGKIHLVYVRWAVLGYYSLNYFQRYWRQVALHGAVFHIIAGRVHQPPDWETISNIAKTLIAETQSSIDKSI